MDEIHVTQMAKKHAEQIAAATVIASRRQGPRPREIFDRELPILVGKLDRAAQQYADLYNQAIHRDKLVCENHETGINVEAPFLWNSALRLQVDPDARRVAHCSISVGDYFAKPDVTIAHWGETLVFKLKGQEIGVDELVTELLDALTERLTEAECAEL